MITNPQQIDLIKEKFNIMQSCINDLEAELGKREDQFNKSKVAFEVGKLNQAFSDAADYLGVYNSKPNFNLQGASRKKSK